MVPSRLVLLAALVACAPGTKDAPDETDTAEETSAPDTDTDVAPVHVATRDPFAPPTDPLSTARAGCGASRSRTPSPPPCMSPAAGR